MSPWDRLLERPSCGHLVQLYQRSNESALINNVALYLSEGLRRDELALAITTPEHRVLLLHGLESLGVDTRAALRNKRLVWLDAHETLSRFIMSGWPDWNRFETVVGGAVRDLKPNEESASFRAYGEMVNILWRARQYAAALRLEQFWNKLLSRFSFSLYCAYCVESMDEKNRSVMLNDVLSAHTHTIPNASPLPSQTASADVSAA
jgi:MEDS: MEthanogen/methylotroph, DcmR Sensory domain